MDTSVKNHILDTNRTQNASIARYFNNSGTATSSYEGFIVFSILSYKFMGQIDIEISPVAGGTERQTRGYMLPH